MRLAPVLLVVLLAIPARAVEFSGSSTTILRSFDVLHVELRDNGQPIQRVISYRPLDQYLRFSWDDFGRRGAWSADVSVRGRVDLGTGKGSWQEDDLDVLLAQARWRSAQRLVGLTLGRQQAITGMGWHAFDGARLDFEKLKRLRVFVHAGYPVDLFEGGASDMGGSTWGMGVTGVLPKHGTIGVDYEIRRGEGEVFDPATFTTHRKDGVLLEETAGFDASFHARKTTFDANADYSLLLDTFGETSFVLGQEIRRKHHLEARWTRVRPIFPSDSIWAVFELNPYDETRLSYEFRGDGPLDVGGYVSFEDYTHEEHPGMTDPDPSDLPEDIRRAAATLRWEGRRDTVHRTEIGWQRGWTGARLGFRHDSDWSLNPRWRVGAGLSVHRYENRYRLDEPDEVAAVRGRIRHDHDGKWDLALEVEQYFGRDRNSMRASLIFGTRFGKARGTLPWWGGAWTRSAASRPGASSVPSAPSAAPSAEAQ